jgi:tetratricopeptide (TPR) repeat protein
MAFCDSDSGVRSVTLFDIARCYEGTDDVQLGKSLALLAKDSSAAADERRAAYHGLFTLRGLPFGGSLDAMSRLSVDSFRVPEDFDWSFVGSFLLDGRQPCPVDPSTWTLSFLSPTEREWYQKTKAGEKAFDAGLYEEAASLLDEAIKLWPIFPRVLLTRAHALMKLGRSDDAVHDLTQAISLAPFFSEAYYQRGLIYEGRGQPELAKADFETATRLRNR